MAASDIPATMSWRATAEAAGSSSNRPNRVTASHAAPVDRITNGTRMAALATDEPIVSTDTLFPEIPEIEHIDPRDIE